MKKPRLLLVCASYPPVLGGSEVEAQRVCVEMMRRGYEVQVICQGGSPMPNVSHWVDPQGVPVRMFGAGFEGRWRDRAYALGVAWTLIGGRYDCVYFLMHGLHLAVGLPLIRLLRKPTVMKVSGSSLISLMARSWIGRLELKWLRQWAYRVLILNEGMVEEALRQGFQREQLLWMPNPVDIDLFAPCDPGSRPALRQRLGIPTEAPTVVYTGRLSSEKGVDVLVEAFARMSPAVPAALLVLVGDGPQRGDLEALAQRQGVMDRVRFTGRLAGDELLSWLQAGDVFALVSPDEGFSVSLLEALSVGLPAVVSAIPANLQLVREGLEGLTAPVGDRAAIAEALRQLLQNATQRQQLGAAGRARVAGNFSTEKVGDLYEALWVELLKHPPGSGTRG